MHRFAASIILPFLLLTLAASLPLRDQEQFSDDLETHRDVVLREATEGERKPAAYLLELLNSFEAAENQPDRHRYNTLRSFETIKIEGCKDTKYSFTFNLSSISEKEDVSDAMFRVYVEIAPHIATKSPAIILTLSTNGSELYRKLLPSLNESQYVDIPIGIKMQEWLKAKQLKYLVSLDVQITTKSGLSACNDDIKIIRNIKNDSSQPSLVVYTYDHDEDKIMDKINRAIKEKMNATDETKETKKKRSAGSIPVNRAPSGDCRKSELIITKEQLAHIMDIRIDYPNEFKLGLCGGECPSSKYINEMHSKITYLLLAKEDKNGRDHLSNKHKYSQCCVPTDYHPINYITYMDHSSVIKSFEKLTVSKCSCVYTYLDDKQSSG